MTTSTDEIFVLCPNRNICKQLMREFVDYMVEACSDNIRVIKHKREVHICGDLYKFVTDDELVMIEKARRETKVVYYTRFERAIELCKRSERRKNK